MTNQDYGKLVNERSQPSPMGKNILWAFLVGGIICTIGQVLINVFGNMGMEKEVASSWSTLCLIAGSVILTGFNIFPKIVKFGGAGALVPITGFANSVVAPAIEYKAEGQIFGIGCKIFTIAGPVILYGILASWGLGVVYWIGGVMAVILKNNKPFYIVVDFKEYEEIKTIQESRKKRIAEMTEQLIEDNKEAFLELAK